MTTSDSFVNAQGAEQESLSTAVRWQDGAAVVAVTGEVDMVTAPGLGEVLSDVLVQAPETLVVDLSEVEFFASAGLSVLVAASQQAGERTALRVVATNTATVRPLQVTALDRKIPVFSSTEAAVAAS